MGGEIYGAGIVIVSAKRVTSEKGTKKLCTVERERRKSLLERMSLFVVGLAGLLAGCVLVASPQGFSPPVVARSITMPENPTMVYVGTAGRTHGKLTEEDLTRQGITVVRDWQSAKNKATEQPLDALLMDATLLTAMTDDDKTWLRAQLPEGVVIAGLGVDLDLFAKALGLETLRAPGEADVPLRADEAFWVYGLILGQPEDVALLQANNWFAHSLQGEDLNISGVKAALNTATGRGRQLLDTKENTEFFFESLRTTIEGLYQARTEYQQGSKPPTKEQQ